MELLLRVLAVAFGIVTLVYFLLSLARTAILNYPSRDPLLGFVKWMTAQVMHALGLIPALRADRQRRFAWYMPAFILIAILTWFVTVLVAFAALYGAFRAETTLRGALVASGSALTTLGFATPSTPQGEALGIVEGMIGLVIVVFILTFVPGYQSAVQARELQLGWLHRRLGENPTGLRVLLWQQNNAAPDERDGFWATWEGWFRQLRATSTLAAPVVYTPTAFPHQSWVSCTSAILDAAAIYTAAVDCNPACAAAICGDEGTDTVCAVAESIGFKPRNQSAPQEVTPQEFDAVLARLGQSGIKLECTGDAAWQRFVARRQQYRAALAYISSRTLTEDYLNFLAADDRLTSGDKTQTTTEHA